MAITIGKYTFNGPFYNVSDVRGQSGVYVILGRNHDHETWNVVDVGESENVLQRLQNHDRKPCWERRGYARLAVAVYYCDEPTRMRIERELRAQYNPPCGDR